MRQEILAVILALLVIGSLGLGYFAGNQVPVKTTTSTATETTTETVTGPQTVTAITMTTTEEVSVQCPVTSGASKLFVNSAFTNGTTISGLGVVLSNSETGYSEWNCSGITPAAFSLVDGQLYTVSMQPQYANCILSYWQGPTTGNSGYYERPIAINQTTTLVAVYACA